MLIYCGLEMYLYFFEAVVSPKRHAVQILNGCYQAASVDFVEQS